MTNSEYFEKNKISFAEAMEIFNEQKSKKGGTKSFDEFLTSAYVETETKFQIGDFIVMRLNAETRTYGCRHNIVFEVINVGYVEDCYTVKCLTPNEFAGPHVGMVMNFPIAYIDRNCILY